MSKINEKQVFISIIGILGVSFLFIIIITKSDYYKEKEYLKFHNLKYSGIITGKNHEYAEDSPYPGNIFLNTGIKLDVKKSIYDKLQIGDSIHKKSNCDSVYYYTKHELIIDDENKFRRTKYLRTKK